MKFWLFNYSKPYTKKRTNIGFGSYPEVSLADASRKRKDAKAFLDDDIDPKFHNEQKEREQEEALDSTFGVFTEKWDQLKLQTVKQETADKVLQTLKKHILPHLENVPIHQLRPKMVISILGPI